MPARSAPPQPANPTARATSTAHSLVDIFKALADETRLRIFRLLTQQELCVCEIEDILDLPQSLVSNHLAVLRRNGLVESRRDAEDARWVFYRASAAAAGALRERLGALLDVQTRPSDRRRAEEVCRLRGR
jgi:ArsR family transcriptional regulator